MAATAALGDPDHLNPALEVPLKVPDPQILTWGVPFRINCSTLPLTPATWCPLCDPRGDKRRDRTHDLLCSLSHPKQNTSLFQRARDRLWTLHCRSVVCSGCFKTSVCKINWKVQHNLVVPILELRSFSNFIISSNWTAALVLADLMLSSSCV